MGDFWVLDLAAPRKGRAAARSAIRDILRESPLTSEMLSIDIDDQAIMKEAVDGEDPADEEDDDDADDFVRNGGGTVNNVPLARIFQIMISQARN